MPHLRLATTTSVENSGLLAAILPAFESRHHVKVDVLPVGSGKALELARRGDIDAVLTHSPAAERRFVVEGFGLGYQVIMRNWFQIVGPAADPAGIQGLDPVAAFRELVASRAPFVSRGDDSGTHVREAELWTLAGARPGATHYVDAGSGMSQTLMVASQKQAYTLTDRATFLFLKDKLDLVLLVEKGDELYNAYAAMWVNPGKSAGVRSDLGEKLVSWLASAEGQAAIGAYRVAGEVLFTPAREVVGVR